MLNRTGTSHPSKGGSAALFAHKALSVITALALALSLCPVFSVAAFADEAAASQADAIQSVSAEEGGAPSAASREGDAGSVAQASEGESLSSAVASDAQDAPAASPSFGATLLSDDDQESSDESAAQAQVFRQADGFEPYQGWQGTSWYDDLDPWYSSSGGADHRACNPGWTLTTPLSIGATGYDISAASECTSSTVTVLTDVNASDTSAALDAYGNVLATYEDPLYFKNIILPSVALDGENVQFTFNYVGAGGVNTSGLFDNHGGIGIATSADPSVWESNPDSVIWDADSSNTLIESCASNWWKNVTVTIPSSDLSENQTYYLFIKNGTAGYFGRIWADIVFQFNTNTSSEAAWSWQGDIADAAYGWAQGNGNVKVGFFNPAPADISVDLTKIGSCYFDTLNKDVELGSKGETTFRVYADGSGSNFVNSLAYIKSNTPFVVYDANPAASGSFDVSSLTPVASATLGNMTFSSPDEDLQALWDAWDEGGRSGDEPSGTYQYYGFDVTVSGLEGGQTYYLVIPADYRYQNAQGPLAKPIVLAFTTEDASAVSWDVSAAGDGSLVAKLHDNGDSTYALKVSGSGAMKDFESASAQPWAEYAASITSVSIAGGATSVGAYAFSGLTAITSVKLPSSMKSIGEGAFQGCLALVAIDASACGSLESIGAGALCFTPGTQTKGSTVYLADANAAALIVGASYSTTSFTNQNLIQQNTCVAVLGGGALTGAIFAMNELAEPSYAGYTFTGWFSDEACTSAAAGWMHFGGSKNVRYAGWDLTDKPILKDDLGTALSAADSRLESIHVSVDGSNISDAEWWVTQDVYDAYAAAVESARAVYDNAKATQDEVDAATAALAEATDAFVAAKQSGLLGEDGVIGSWEVGATEPSAVKATLTSDGTLTFSGTGDMVAFASASDAGNAGDVPDTNRPWVNNLADITKVVFEAGVAPTNLSYYFLNCENLISVEGMPASVLAMSGAFQGCPLLTELPSGLLLPASASEKAFLVGEPYSADSLLTTYADAPVDQSVLEYDWASDNRRLVVRETLEINTVEEFKAFADAVNGGKTYEGCTVILNANLDLSGLGSWTPIAPSRTVSFQGAFDGQGHVVSGFTVANGSYYAGLFGNVSGGSVKNLSIENASVTGSAFVGGVVAQAAAGATVENCSSSASVEGLQGSFVTGGVVGYAYNNASVIGCSNAGPVKGTSHVGGVVGQGYSHKLIDFCSNTGSVVYAGEQGDHGIGGVVGEIYGGSYPNTYPVSRSFNTGTVLNEGGAAYAGGVVGFLSASAVCSNSYNAGTVSTPEAQYAYGSYTGGVAGRIYNSSMASCYNVGSVSGVGTLGGVLGGVVNASDAANAVNLYYLDTCVPEGTTNAYGTAKIAAELMALSSLYGFDTDVWTVDPSAAYPYPTLSSGEAPEAISWDVSAAQDGSVMASLAKNEDGSTYTLVFSGEGAMKDFAAASETPWYAEYASLITKAVVGDGVTNIGAYALGLENLSAVKGGNALGVIGDFAFQGAVNLVAADLSSCTLTSVAASSFGIGKDAIKTQRTVYVKDTASATAMQAYVSDANALTAVAVLRVGTAIPTTTTIGFADDVEFESGVVAKPSADGYVFVAWTTDTAGMWPESEPYWQPMTTKTLYAKFSKSIVVEEPVQYTGEQGLDQKVTLLDVAALPSSTPNPNVLFYGNQDGFYDNRFTGEPFDADGRIEFAFIMTRGTNANGGNGDYQMSFCLPFISILDEEGNVVASYDDGNGLLRKYAIYFNGVEATSGKTITAVKIGVEPGTLEPGSYTLRFGKGFGANNGISFLMMDVDFQFEVVAKEKYELAYSVDDAAGTATITGADTLVEGAFDVAIPQTVTDSETGVSYDVAAIAPNAFNGNAGVTSIDVPASVTSIGSGAFANMANLETVTVHAQGEGVPTWGEGVFTGSHDCLLYGYANSTASSAAAGYDNVTYRSLEDGFYVNGVAIEEGSTITLTKEAPEAAIVAVHGGAIDTTSYQGFISNTNVASHENTSAFGWNVLTGKANGTAQLVVRTPDGADVLTVGLAAQGFDEEASAERTVLAEYQGNGSTIIAQGMGTVTTTSYDETLRYYDNYLEDGYPVENAVFTLDIAGPGSAWGPEHAGWNWAQFLANVNSCITLRDAEGAIIARPGAGLTITSLVKSPSTVAFAVDGGILKAGETYTVVVDENMTGHNVAAPLEKAVHWTFTVKQADLASAGYVVGEADPIASEWTGEEITPKVSVLAPVPATSIWDDAAAEQVVTPASTRELTEGVDFELSYENNVNAGIGTMVVKGIGNYSGEVTRYFQILAAHIERADLLEAIDDAQRCLDGVVAAESDEGLAAGTQWALPEDIADFKASIDDAKAVAADESASQAALDEAYATLQNAQAFFAEQCVKTVEGEAPEPTIAGEWLEGSGGWWYRHTDGSYTAYGWEFIDGAWYLFDGSGWMLTGWQHWSGAWYYLQPNGAMYTGWLHDGAWYFLDDEGVMRTGWFKDGDSWYYADASGAMQTGWLNSNGTWYYLQPSGVMQTGWASIGGVWYYFTSGGAMVSSSWIGFGSGDSKTWYYLGSSGAMATGWQSVGGAWYYFQPSGIMLTGWLSWGGSWYYLNPDSDGAMATGWFQDETEAWYYADAVGVMQHDCWVGNYYLTSSGVMATNQWIGSYYVGADGAWVPGV